MRKDAATPAISLSRFGLLIIIFAALFNALTSHFGETVLFTIPGNIPLISGPVTLEALVFGAINGLVLTGILGAFTVLNQALPVRSLISLIPRAFYPLAVVTSIAVTYIPVTTRQYRQIREAQSVRGHIMRGLRDWTPMIMPLLVGGLERAMMLAEAMTARGFASPKPNGQSSNQGYALLGGLTLVLTGWLALMVAGWVIIGWLCILVGIGLLVWGMWSRSKRVPHTNYRRESWGLADGLVMLGIVLVLCFYLLSIPGVDKSSLTYNPYPAITIPKFDPLIGLATLGLLFPAGIMYVVRSGDKNTG
jgi:energy-coupling factor transport system permease protein